jgi:hypothetical protein
MHIDREGVDVFVVRRKSQHQLAVALDVGEGPQAKAVCRLPPIHVYDLHQIRQNLVNYGIRFNRYFIEYNL